MPHSGQFELEHVRCDLCGCGDYNVRYRKPDNWLWLNQFEYPVVACVDCGLTYVNPRPTFATNALLYPPGYHDGRDDAEHQRRYLVQFTYIEQLKASRILDVGCARGDWLHFIGTKWPDAELHGVDAFSDGVSDAKIHFHRTTLPQAPLPDGHFDLVTSWAVFEHLHTPMDYFQSVSRALKPGGKFVFLVTNANSLYGRAAYCEDVPRHLYHFSEKTLEKYAQKCGLRLEETRYDDRLWDGRGWGTCAFGLARLAGANWESMYFKRSNIIQKALMKMGAIADRVLFATHWEAALRRSGIIVAIMSK